MAAFAPLSLPADFIRSGGGWGGGGGGESDPGLALFYYSFIYLFKSPFSPIAPRDALLLYKRVSAGRGGEGLQEGGGGSAGQANNIISHRGASAAKVTTAGGEGEGGGGRAARKKN